MWLRTVAAIGAFCQWCLVNDVVIGLLAVAVAAVARLAPERVPLLRRVAAGRAAPDTAA